MLKESIICIVIIVVIVVGNFVTQNYTTKLVDVMENKMQELEKILLEREEKDSEKVKEQAKTKLEEIHEEWGNRRKKLSFYIEHDEIEKVETNLSDLNHLVEEEEYTEVVKQLDESVFLLKHIEKKYAFSLENIF